jgi:hypothetical protein
MIFRAVESMAVKRMAQSMVKLKQCANNLATEQRCKQIGHKMLA